MYIIYSICVYIILNISYNLGYMVYIYMYGTGWDILYISRINNGIYSTNSN